jgi:hypothetical protein
MTYQNMSGHDDILIGYTGGLIFIITCGREFADFLC